MRRILALGATVLPGLLLAMVTAPALFAGININVEYVRKSVVFLYSADADGNAKDPIGTGFIVEVPTLSRPTQSYKLLVTARHMVDPNWTHCAGGQPIKLLMRVNKKNFDPSKDESGIADLDLSGDINAGKTWLVSSDAEVDAAVALLNGSMLEKYDLEGVHVSDFPTPDELKTFVAGDAVVSAGLLPKASGKRRNYPIFKFGNISSIPNETLAPDCSPGIPGPAVKAWLIAASLVPGNSGSPIYYVPPGFAGVTMGTANMRPVLLGIQSFSFIPWDVAGMTPVEYLYEILQKASLPDADLHRGSQRAQPASPPADTVSDNEVETLGCVWLGGGGGRKSPSRLYSRFEKGAPGLASFLRDLEPYWRHGSTDGGP